MNLQISHHHLCDDSVHVVAEAGQVHNGSVNHAIKLAEAAYNAGASFIKYQLFDPANLAAPHSPPYWSTHHESQLEAFSEFGQLTEDEWRQVKSACDKIGITFFATPFDIPSVDFLYSLAVPCFKVASGDITNRPLLRRLAYYSLPVVLSTGASNPYEIRRGIEWLSPAPVIILACTLSYPTHLRDAHLGRIETLHQHFPNNFLGYSDHTTSPLTSLPAAALGATVLEKHFTLEQSGPVDDSYMAHTPSLLAKYVQNAELGTIMRGNPSLTPAQCELPARRGARRGTYAARYIPRGHTFNRGDFVFLRPVTHISPTDSEYLIGTQAVRDYEPGEPI